MSLLWEIMQSKKYRGHLEKSEVAAKGTNPGTSEVKPDEQFEMPVKMPSAIDPFKRPLADIKE
jgi:hypothetical protein